MSLALRITLLVTAQIILIVASFLTIIYFESQSSLAGNTVNVAGKNRHLTSQAQIEMDKVLFHNQDRHATTDVIERLKDNIILLKYGSMTDGIETVPIATRFNDQWYAIWDVFLRYEIKANELMRNDLRTDSDAEELEQIGEQLISLSDILTEDLGYDVEALAYQLVTLQIIFGVINVASHAFLIYVIWRMFQRHSLQIAKSERFATVGQFASMIAHDLRNPLAVISNSANIIQYRRDPNIIDREIRRINRSIDRMAHQIEEVMNHVKSSPFITEPNSMLEILQSSVDSLEIPDNINVITPRNDLTILTNYTKMEFVFTNLILNAMQTIRDKPGHITIRSEEHPESVSMIFENSGEAISEENLEKIFEPLFTTKMQGTGLGLASCRNIIQRHGGTITASIHPTTFTISIPKEQS